MHVIYKYKKRYC